MIDVLVTIVLVILLCGVFYWLVNAAPFIAEPFKASAAWFILVICFVWIIAILFGGAPLIHIAGMRR
jgi:hypothetical protein